MSANHDPSRWIKSKFRCPACNRFLWKLLVQNGCAFFCGFGPCPSVNANDGAKGATEAQAISNLEKLIDTEDYEIEPEREQDYPEFPLKNGRRLKWKD